MEDFLLGLLMLKKLTAYQLHMGIKHNYEGICSSSIGNIQKALKKLHEQGYVNLEELQEGKVLKKLYSITNTGREKFLEWVSQPVDLLKVKNIEYGRMLFMGFLSKDKQKENLGAIIQNYQEALEYMSIVESRATSLTDKELDDFYKDTKDHLEDTASFFGKEDFAELYKDLRTYSMATLLVTINEIKHNLKWFEDFKKQLEEN